MEIWKNNVLQLDKNLSDSYIQGVANAAIEKLETSDHGGYKARKLHQVLLRRKSEMERWFMERKVSEAKKNNKRLTLDELIELAPER